jgi:DNA-directed RNA polymerase subunit RPC12/RpoP
VRRGRRKSQRREEAGPGPDLTYPKGGEALATQTQATRYVCLACGSEGLLSGDDAAGGRARCPHCGRLIEVEAELADAEAAPEPAARLLPAG